VAEQRPDLSIGEVGVENDHRLSRFKEVKHGPAVSGKVECHRSFIRRWIKGHLEMENAIKSLGRNMFHQPMPHL